MMKKSILILLGILLAGSGALAMRPRAQSLMAVARNMGQTRISSVGFKARTDGSHNERERFTQDEGYGSRYLMPAAVVSGLSLSAQDASDESSNKIDIFNINLVLTKFNEGSAQDKSALALKVADHITQFKIDDIITLLQQTKAQEHDVIIQAIAQKITYFSTENIYSILKHDINENTHQILAQALQKNYNYFNSYAIFGFELAPGKVFNWHNKFIKLIKVLNHKYHSIFLQPIVQNVNAYSDLNLRDLFAHVDEQGQIMLATAIAQHVNKHPEWFLSHFLPENFWVSQNKEAKIVATPALKILAAAFTPAICMHISQREVLYPEILGALQIADDKSQTLIIDALALNIKKNIQDYQAYRNFEYLVDYLSECSETNQGRFIESILSIIDTAFNNSRKTIFLPYPHYTLSQLLGVSHERAQNAICGFINKNLDKFTDLDVRYIFENADPHSRMTLMKDILKNNPDRVEGIFSFIKKSSVIEAIVQYSNDMIPVLPDWVLSSLLVDADGDDAQVVATTCLMNLNEIIYKLNPDALQVIKKYANDEDKQAINGIVDGHINEFIKEQALDTQSAAHLKENSHNAWEYIRTVVHNEGAKAAFIRALNYEHAVSSHSAVFYHSQRSPVYWLEVLYTKLWQQKHNQKIDNYLFTRFPHEGSELSNAILQADGHKKRQNLLVNGRPYDERQDSLRPYLFFANYALFGNSGNWGSCSIYYFMNNFNIADPKISTQNILSKFGEETIFDAYKQDFEQIENEFKAIVPHSVLLQLQVPDKAINNHVYLAKPGGFNKALKIEGKYTRDVATVIKTLKTKPGSIKDSDMQEFCVVMTPDTVHTLHEQGAQIKVYGDFEQAKFDALMVKLEALIERIAQEHPDVFSAKMTPAQSYRAFKPVLDELITQKN